jgi:hypothetical protein
VTISVRAGARRVGLLTTTASDGGRLRKAAGFVVASLGVTRLDHRAANIEVLEDLCNTMKFGHSARWATSHRIE